MLDCRNGKARVCARCRRSSVEEKSVGSDLNCRIAGEGTNWSFNDRLSSLRIPSCC